MTVAFEDMAADLLNDTVYGNKFIPYKPSPQQQVFLSLPTFESLYGGAAGGGKSVALLMAALMYVGCPGYHALLLRRTFADLALPGALIPMSKEWLYNTPAVWNGGSKEWTFPSGATLGFGYLDKEDDKYRYQSSEFHYIGFDELTQFTESQYTYLLSRIRRKSASSLPLRARAASNPGGVGHDWVKARFISNPNDVEFPFIPAKLEDNIEIDQFEYNKALDRLDPVTRAQLRHGDWSIKPEGNMFKRSWFEVVQSLPNDVVRWHRHWDLAATPMTRDNTDPDWAAGCKMGIRLDGRFIIADITKLRGTPQEVEETVKQCAIIDGNECSITIEEEPGSAGKSLVDSYARRVLAGFDVQGKKPTGDKVIRAKPLSAACERRHVSLLAGNWNHDFLDELGAFPEVAHDDQVDAASGAFASVAADYLKQEAIDLGAAFRRAF